METYGKILLIAMPVFLALVLLEKWYGWYKGKDTVRQMDMISSLSSGITNVTKDVLGLSVVIISYEWLVNKIAVIHLTPVVWVYVAAFIALDFAGYWVHRIEHRFNIFWNLHIIHHSSEEFNLACALRQSIAEIVKVFTVFLIPAALLGVPAKVIAIVAPIQLFAQFWYHTQHINKMGWLEKVIVTPSHHRVHHAINKEYIDKNFSQIFIIWDKLFGTFQQELQGVPPVYGITRPARTWNPIKINFIHAWLLIKDAWHTKGWKDKFKIWLMPTGWRPADVAEKFPVYKIDNVYHFEKYAPESSNELVVWSWTQLTILLIATSYLFANIAAIGSPGFFVYGLFIFLSVYSFTELMDRKRFALLWEILKNILGVFIIYKTGGWFSNSPSVIQLNIPILSWLLLSTFITAWFVFIEFKPAKAPRFFITQND
ncbi:sterol desaturase family protein [Ginsengibacter hankyongi]|uniref:Sterol desaturase family protein n=1 Tax=Ginsengibacter hankyongi TaxID=2607284 RepID=A0A5J5ING5_9BACT|nr:sterol desaturase family protein [Ginsengibacter hankyongi]KAA9041527.1 sterol desaturase family protein [Ginsengibacter hankyongi]